MHFTGSGNKPLRLFPVLMDTFSIIRYLAATKIEWDQLIGLTSITRLCSGYSACHAGSLSKWLVFLWQVSRSQWRYRCKKPVLHWSENHPNVDHHAGGHFNFNFQKGPYKNYSRNLQVVIVEWHDLSETKRGVQSPTCTRYIQSICPSNFPAGGRSPQLWEISKKRPKTLLGKRLTRTYVKAEIGKGDHTSFGFSEEIEKYSLGRATGNPNAELGARSHRLFEAGKDGFLLFTNLPALNRGLVSKNLKSENLTGRVDGDAIMAPLGYYGAVFGLSSPCTKEKPQTVRSVLPA